ncbi:MAG: CRTAC1 family protein [Candidatus Polarisedimenticolia bacterium]
MLAVLLWVLAAAPPAIFTNVTPASGLESAVQTVGRADKDYISDTIGTGIAAFDMDNDGWQDLYLANGSRLGGYPPGQEPHPYLFRNKGGNTFEDVTRDSGVDQAFWGSGVAVGDYDNDGLTDLYVTAYGPNHLYRNLGGGRFQDVSGPAGVDAESWGASASFVDIDLDGDLDLFVTTYVDFDPREIPPRGDPNHPCMYRGFMVMCGPTGLKGEPDILYRNNGDGTFSNVTSAAGIRTDVGLFGLGVAVGDYDADADPDLYVANDATPNQLYRNRGDGTFEEVAAMSGAAYGVDGTEAGSMGTAFGDYDGDGALDLVITNFSHQSYQLLRQSEGLFFEDVSYTTGIYAATFLFLGWATDFFDYDHDGWLDLFFLNGHVYPGVDAMQIGSTYRQTNHLMHNVAGPDGLRTYEDVSSRAGPDFAAARSHRAGGAFDSDRDGDLDLVAGVMDEGPVLLRNDAGTAGGSWLQVRPVGSAANRSGIGVRLEAQVKGRRLVRYTGASSFLWGADPRAHFGLGDARKVDSLEVIWPGGRRQTVRNLAANTAWVLVEGRDPVPDVPQGAAR